MRARARSRAHAPTDSCTPALAGRAHGTRRRACTPSPTASRMRYEYFVATGTDKRALSSV